MIALDLDNTIINYAAAFARAARVMGLVVGQEVAPMPKALIKSLAFKQGGNELWTRMQGLAYGPHLADATPYDGVREFMEKAIQSCKAIAIVSHKTELPASGPRFYLRVAASQWLQRQGLTLEGRVQVHYCDTRAAKVARVQALGAAALVDDLPEVYLEAGFPSSTRFVLFDPMNEHQEWSETERVRTWQDAARLLL